MGGVCAVGSNNSVAEEPGEEHLPLAPAGVTTVAPGSSSAPATAAAENRPGWHLGRGTRWTSYSHDRLFAVEPDGRISMNRSLSELCVRSLCRALPMVDEVPSGLPVDLTQQVLSSLVDHSCLDADTLRKLCNCEFLSLSLSTCRDVDNTWLHATSAVSVRTLERLDVSKCSKLTTDGVLQLHALKALTAASFAECHLLDGAATLCLTTSTRLRELNCTNCRRLDDNGVQNIRHLTQLTTLQLSGTDVSDLALEHIAALTGLQSLHLERCRRLSDRGVPQLVSLRRLQDLRLGWCSGISDVSLHLLASLPHRGTSAAPLLAVGTAMNGAGGGGAIATSQRAQTFLPDANELRSGTAGDSFPMLAPFPVGPASPESPVSSGSTPPAHSASARSRGRASSYPPDAWVPMLPAPLPLTRLDLSRCAITDDGVHQLTALPELQRLALSGCQSVTDDGITALERLPRLTWLDVSSIQRLSRVHGLLGTLEYLDLSHTAVDDHAILSMLHATRRRLDEANKGHPPHRPLLPREHAVSLGTAAELEHGEDEAALRNSHGNGWAQEQRHEHWTVTNKPRLRSLLLDSCVVTDRGVDTLVEVDSLTKLNLADTRVSDAGMSQIAAKLGRLRSLSLFFCDVSDQGLQFLSVLTNLTELNLDNREISDLGLVPLSAMTQLRTLDVFSAFRVTDDGVAHISKLASLTSLELCGGRLTNLAVAHLTGLVNLTALNLAQNLGINDEALKCVTKLSSLTELNMSECRVTSNGLPWLAQLPTLASLALVNCRFVTESAIEQLQRDLPALRCVRV